MSPNNEKVKPDTMAPEIKRLAWFERKFTFGLPAAMLPFYLDRLEGTLDRVEQRVRRVGDDILSEKFKGKWSIKQNIGHLAEVDQVANKRIDEIISGSESMAPAVFEPKNYNPWTIGRVLAFFREARTANIRKYRELSEKELLMTSIHPRLKVPMTPVDLAWFDAEHDDHHLLRIKDIIEALSR